MQRAEVLRAAGEAIVDRGLNYGQPEDNFANIARMWNAHLFNRGLLRYVGGIEPFDVALMMANVKQVRIACDPNHADSWVDFAGYGACGAEVARAGRPLSLSPTKEEIVHRLFTDEQAEDRTRPVVTGHGP